MKQLVVLGGKGGTGKTTVAAALAHLMAAERRLVLADADVDAPNLGLLLAPEVQYGERFTGGAEAVIDAEACIIAAVAWRCVALSGGAQRRRVRSTRSPVRAARPAPTVSGAVLTMRRPRTANGTPLKTRLGDFAARLFPGQELGKLVSLVRHQAQLLARAGIEVGAGGRLAGHRLR